MVGRRIRVRGTTGSGKTTLARDLGRILGYPVVEMDQVYWRPGWTKPSPEEFEKDLVAALSTPAWVCCGNYSAASAVLDRLCDTVVWLDLPWWVSFPRLFARTVRRGIRKEMLWGHSQESLWTSFFSHDSILLWHMRTYAKNRRRADLFFAGLPDGVTGHRLRTPADVDAFVSQVAAWQADQTGRIDRK